jgi:hypothetical protein
MMTYAELFKKLFEEDPIADPDFPERTTRDENGITVLGGPAKLPDLSCASDLHIKIEGDKLILRWRDNEAATGEDIFYGPDWSKPLSFDDFDELHTWIYEM